MHHMAWLPFVLPLLAVCPPHPPPPTGQAQTGASMKMERVLTESYSGIADRRRLVIQNADAWLTLWSEAMRGREPAPEPPAVDFANEMVIVASMGRRGTGGYQITIDEVTRSGSEIAVVVRETSPGANCFFTQAFTAPVAAVKVAKSEAALTFVERTERQDCS